MRLIDKYSWRINSIWNLPWDYDLPRRLRWPPLIQLSNQPNNQTEQTPKLSELFRSYPIANDHTTVLKGNNFVLWRSGLTSVRLENPKNNFYIRISDWKYFEAFLILINLIIRRHKLQGAVIIFLLNFFNFLTMWSVIRWLFGRNL